MNAEQRDLIERVIHSLSTEPQKWRRDRYRVSHESGAVSVWIGSGIDFVRVESGDYGPTLAGRDAIFYGWAVPWRRRLMKAARSIPSTENGQIERVISKANLSPA